jgi:hypothetical protein
MIWSQKAKSFGLGYCLQGSVFLFGSYSSRQRIDDDALSVPARSINFLVEQEWVLGDRASSPGRPFLLYAGSTEEPVGLLSLRSGF